MRIYEYGSWDAPALLLLPGTCCHWKKNFRHVIPLLKDDFHVICVSYDGFDENEDTVFTDVITEVEKLEHMILKGFCGHISTAYGCSLGGSLVGLLLQRRIIRMDHAILGSSDLDQDPEWKAKLKCKVAVPLLHKIVSTGEYPKALRGLMEKKRTPYRDKFMEMFSIGQGGLPFIKRESVYSQLYSDLITPLEEGIYVPDTTVHCFYAAKMGEKYLQRYQKHFRNPVIHRFDMEHEELLVLHPEQWAQKVKEVCL
ncbi:MAG: alpha/beta hydrolase [Clostridia bacterium]|nr:alpha/beta hydrolase [Clostridia bacterium]